MSALEARDAARDTAPVQLWPSVTLNGRRPQPRSLVNRNVYIGKHRTSVRLEPAMWQALAEICQREGKSKHELCTMISQRRASLSLTSAIRVFIMSYFRAAATDEGHASAGHGTLL